MSFFSDFLKSYASDYDTLGQGQVMTAVKKENARQKLEGTYNNYSNVLTDSLSNILQAYQTSALKAERQSVKDFQQWSDAQNDLAWQRSESSAQKQMDFQRQQADLAWQRSESSAQKQMQFQEKMWQKSADYNTQMANTSYQRAVSDLRKAGLNPILAVQRGGASSPTVSIPSGASSSASAMSGASATASQPYSVKGDYSKAKQTDLNSLQVILGMFSNVFTSALKLLK